MAPAPFYEEPILNSPYAAPTRYHDLDDEGQPTDRPPIDGRRPSKLIAAVPKSRKRKKGEAEGQADLGLDSADEDDQAQALNAINEIRQHVSSWRKLPNPKDWGVTPATAELLTYWREIEFEGIRPFFCQVEAVETIIWLTEVARGHNTHKKYWENLRSASAEANPELLRLAMKMATGAGKTTVMAMLIAWHTVNAARSPGSKLFSRGFLIVAPGITIRDRLRVLLPNDVENYYDKRQLVPPSMQRDLKQAKIVVTNYHAFQLRDVLDTNKTGKAALQGDGPPLKTLESDGVMIRRVADELARLKNIIVINDEAHHCYRERPESADARKLDADEKAEAKKDNEAARVWINGLEAFKRKVGLNAVYDLSATPYFLRGSGYREGLLFPWTVSDFSLMDAIECGIVKLPRIPVADSISSAEMPVYRDLWKNIAGDMPKRGAAKGGGDASPNSLPATLRTALYSLYDHYVEEDKAWRKQGIDVPPVFIVVCNNTSTSKLVAEWISGWDRPNEDGDMINEHKGHLELFRNYDENGNRLAMPNTLLIDSYQLESGDALDTNFRKMAAPQIELFQRERRHRMGAGDVSEPSDADLLREVMNTIGEKDRLGEKVRCVVSVSMLTEGWDANTVTHILGVRAFGTQLLCEQVVGRGLRRYSYQANKEEKFAVEYSNVLGIPFNFTVSAQKAPPKPPKKTIRVAAVKERASLEIVFPRVVGYREARLPDRLTAKFSDSCRLVIDDTMVGPGETVIEGIVGEGAILTVAEAREKRPSSIAYNLAKKVLYTHFLDANGEAKQHLFIPIQRICRRWIDGGYLECKGKTKPWMLEYPDIADKAANRIRTAILESHRDETEIVATLDPYNPKGSSRHVGFQTVKDVYAPKHKSHINAVVLDSGWEGEFARAAEFHPRVISFVKNQGLGFEVPWLDGAIPRKYLPDFIVRIDDGAKPGDNINDPLNLVVEIKGYRGEGAQAKAAAMKTQWIPGVNNLGGFGRWSFVEFGDVHLIQSEFETLIDRAIAENTAEGESNQ